MTAITTPCGARAAERPGDTRQPLSVAHAYLRAVYARDFAEAYCYMSAEDQRCVAAFPRACTN